MIPTPWPVIDYLIVSCYVCEGKKLTCLLKLRDVILRRQRIGHRRVRPTVASSEWRFKPAVSSEKSWHVYSRYSPPSCSRVELVTWSATSKLLSYLRCYIGGFSSNFTLHGRQKLCTEYYWNNWTHWIMDSHFPCSLKLLMNFCFFFNNEYTIIIIVHLFFFFALFHKLESKDCNRRILSRESNQKEIQVAAFSANTAWFT